MYIEIYKFHKCIACKFCCANIVLPFLLSKIPTMIPMKIIIHSS